MKATFSAREPNILMEAQPGDLFVPLGPDLVECVCAVRSVYSSLVEPKVDVHRELELDPNAKRPVIVVACRVGAGEPEYYPTGFQLELSGATPISFLEQVEPAAFRERVALSDAAIRAIRENALGQRIGKYDIKCSVKFDRPPDIDNVGPTLADCVSREERQISRL